MNRIAASRSCRLVAIAITALSLPAFALPKAAEHENAPVTFAADTAKPKITASGKKPVPAKTGKASASSTKTKTSAPAAKPKHKK